MNEPTTVVWEGHPHAPAPLAAILRAGRCRVVDDADRAVPFGPRRVAAEAVRGLWLRTLDLALGGIAAAVAPRSAVPRRLCPPAAGPVVLVLPVLPDLSHTFVYREALAILRQRPDWRVVVLARNARAPVHEEAAALLPQATYVPRDGITARAARLAVWLCRRAGRELFALYRREPGGSVQDLLGKLPLRAGDHPGNAFALADLLAPLRPRHLHVYGSTYAANVTMGAAHLLGVPFSISSYVDFEFPYAHKMLAEKLARATFCRVVTAFCAARLRQLHGLPAERVPTILLGLDLADWRDRAAPPGRGVLVSAARLVEKKGLRFVPAALAALRAHGVACRWRVIGDGPELAAIRAECERHGVADAVLFLGPQGNDVVRRELLAADAALLPCVIAADGERDGIPIFLCEAMALGVPVVTTDVSGIPELVRDGDTGFVCAPADSAALTAALLRLLRDPAAARTVAERGRDLVHRVLDVDALSARLVAEIERAPV